MSSIVVCHLVIDSDFVIMAGADVPPARDHRSLRGQQLLAAQKANAAPLSRRRVEFKRLQLPYFNSLQLAAAKLHRDLVRAVLSAL